MAPSLRNPRLLYAIALLLLIAALVALPMLLAASEARLALGVVGGLIAGLSLMVYAQLPSAAMVKQQSQLSRELENAHRRLDLASRLGGIGQWEWRLRDDRVWWSPEVCDLYGVEPSKAPTTLKEASVFVHPDDLKRVRHYVEEARKGTRNIEADFRVRRLDGGIRCLATRGELVTLPSGDQVIQGVQQDITSVTNARRRLQLVEAQYRFLFEHTPMSMWVFDRDTRRLLAVNDEAVSRYGDGERSELSRPLTMLDFSGAEEQPEVREARLHGEQGEGQGQIWTYRRPDGTVLQAAVFSQDIEFDQHPARLVAAQDIDEHDRNRDLFQLVAMATSDAIYEWDIVRNALWISDSFFTSFGYERSTFPPTMSSWKTRIHPDDANRIVTSLAKAANSGAESWSAEYSFQRGDGDYATVLHRGFFLRDADGRALRMVGGWIDVTEKRRVATDLRLLRRAVESATTGIIIAEAPAEGLPIVYVNSAFEAITGYKASEVVGHNCNFLDRQDGNEPSLEAIREAIAEHKEVRVTLRNHRKDGEPFWNDLQLSPLFDESGALTHYMGVVNDVTERHHYEEQLAYRATHDDLTGLPNRQLVIDRLNHAIQAARRRDGTVTVLFIDLDNFKTVNDTVGHASGDVVLRATADRLSGLVRGSDTAGRFGGDEFILVLEDDESQVTTQQVIDRVAGALSEPIDVDGETHTLTISIGHCMYPRDGGTADALLLNADIAMYQAKRQGRNRAVAYSADFDQSESARVQLVAQLRDALARNEFSLAFQPLFRSSGRAVAMEALIRWNHPTKGELLPGYFLEACEESGLIVDLERSVLAAAAGFHRRLEQAGFGHIRIAVNVSSSHFAHDLFADVERVVKEFELPPGSLEIELTESVIMESPELAIDTMTRLAEIGVSSTVDDFGTGYSSLAYLKRLPIVRVKIDRAFVRDLGSDLSDRSICESIISLARTMDLTTVAEGVETDFQHQWLRDHGVDEFQGFLLGRPEPFDRVLEELSRVR